MPFLKFVCAIDGQYDAFRSVNAPSGEVPPCPVCQTPGETDWSVWRNENRTTVPPIIVFQAPDGSMRFPGTSDGPSAKRYESLGYTRVELRGFADVRRFEGKVNQQEMSKIQRRVERQQQALAIGEARRRSDLFHGFRHGFQIPETVIARNGEHVKTGRMKTVHLSARAKDIGALLIERNNQKRVHSHEPGFFVEAYSNNRSNRDESRDERGRRRRD